jgi:RimJ/RimL family protein N-acetyltransferase
MRTGRPCWPVLSFAGAFHLWHNLSMKLDAPGLEVANVRLDRVNEAHREILATSGAIEAMWNWMPLMDTGTSFNAYFDQTLQDAREGRMVPFAITRLSDGAFCGVVTYMNIVRLHRRLRIGYRWHPENLRGGLEFAATSLALMQRARECRFQRIEFLVNVANKEAIAAVERFGAAREGVLRHYMRTANGLWADVAAFSLIGPEIDRTIDSLHQHVDALAAA